MTTIFDENGEARFSLPSRDLTGDLDTLAARVASLDGGSCSFLRSATFQLLGKVGREQVGPLLRSLACASWGGTPAQLQDLPDANPRRYCGYFFREGDIAWNCRTCQMDSSCVQCDHCFQLSDHTGHEVYFHKAQPGCCCDCGDTEAWKPEGCCPHHRPNDAEEYRDPVEALPHDLRSPAKAVVAAARDYVLHVLAGTVAGYELAVTEEACHADFRPGCAEKEGQRYVVRVHNDDVHTYDDVRSALMRAGLDTAKAQDLTERVDREGEGVVGGARRTPAGILRNLVPSVILPLAKTGLICSVVRAEHLAEEGKAIAVLNTLQELANVNDGLCRLVGESICEACCAPASDPHTQAMFCSRRIGLEEVWDEDARRRVVRGTQVLTSFAGREVENRHTYSTPNDWAREHFANEPTGSSALAIMVISDALLPKAVREAVHKLLMQLLQDTRFFRPKFAASFVRFFPVLSLHYANGIGVQSDSIFGFSVQIFTTPSVVHEQCVGDGESSGSPLIVALLQSCINAFGAAKETRDASAGRWIGHHLILHGRYTTCGLTDLQYSFATPGVALQTVAGNRESGLLQTLLFVVSQMDAFKRVRNAHVEYESALWVNAFNLTLSVSDFVKGLVDACFKHHGPVFRERLATHDDIVKVGHYRQREGESGSEGTAGDRAFAAIANIGLTAIDRFIDVTAQMAAAKIVQPTPHGITLRVVKQCEGVEEEDLDTLYPHPMPRPSPSMPYVRCFVSRDPVSIHAPICRLIGRAAVSAAERSVSLKPLRDALAERPLLAMALCELPSRCLAVAAQVRAGFWRRNGEHLAHQLESYAEPPFCDKFRDLDIRALQVLCGDGRLRGACVARLLDRFQCAKYLLSPDCDLEALQELRIGRPFTAGLSGHLLPTVLSEYQPAVADAFLHTAIILATELPLAPPQALRRELVHALAAGDLSYSQAVRLTPHVESEQELLDALSAVADRAPGAAGGPTLFRMKDDEWESYDPAYFRLRRAKHEAAQDRLAARNARSGAKPRPLAPPLATAGVLAGYEGCREVLLEPVVLAATAGALARCLERLSLPLLARALHAVTLQLRVADSLGRNDDFSAWLCGAGAPGASGAPPLELLHRLEATLAAANAGVALREGAAYALLRANGLSDGCAQLLSRLGYAAGGLDDSARKKQKLKEKRRKKAQRLALKRMQARAATFSTKFQEDLDGDANAAAAPDGGAPAPAAEAEAPPEADGLDAGASECIMCHTRCNKPIAHLCAAQRSTVFRHAAFDHARRCGRADARVHRVVGASGCQVRETVAIGGGASLSVLPHGALCVCGERIGRRVKVLWPVEGWASLWTEDNYAILAPALDRSGLMRHGGRRVQMHFCGHCVHFECWDAYVASVVAQAERGRAGIAGNAASVRQGEALCPLCKRLTNCLVPHVEPRLQANLDAQRAAHPADDAAGLLAALASAAPPGPPGADAAVAMASRLATTVHEIGNASGFFPRHPNGDARLFSTPAVAASPRDALRELHAAFAALAHNVALAAALCDGDVLEHAPPAEVAGLRQLGAALSVKVLADGAVGRGFVLPAVAAALEAVRSGASYAQLLARLSEIGGRGGGGPWDELLLRQSVCACDDHGEKDGIRHMALQDAALSDGGDGFLAHPWLHLPWACQDLQLMATLVVTLAGHRALRSLAEVLLPLRVLQVLLETSADAGPSSPSSSPAPPAPPAFAALRRRVLTDAKVPFREAGAGAALQRATAAARSLALNLALLAHVAEAPGAPLSSDEDLLSWLGLAPPEQWAADGAPAGVMAAGARHYAEYLERTDAADVEDDGAAGEIAAAAALAAEGGARDGPWWRSGLEEGSGDRRQAQLVTDTGNSGAFAGLGGADEEEEEEEEEEEAVGMAAEGGDAEELVWNAPPGWEAAYAVVQGAHEQIEAEMAAQAALQEALMEEEEEEEAPAGLSEGEEAPMDVAETTEAPGSAQLLRPPGRRLAGHMLARLKQSTRTVMANSNVERDLERLYERSGAADLLPSLLPVHGFLRDASHALYDAPLKEARLVALPERFTELYKGLERHCKTLARHNEPALCLVCGDVINAGRRPGRRTSSYAGDATLHALSCGRGTGVFLLLNRSSTLFVRGVFASFGPSPYVDCYGEEDINLRRGRPLSLSKERYERLRQTWLHHRIAEVVTSARSTADRTITTGYY